MEKKAFMFYMNWKKQIDVLDDQELRRLINNLINYHLGNEIELQTKTDILVWQGILPGLEANRDKYDKKVLANRENGKLGGAPKGNGNASKGKNNPEQPKQPDNREQENGKGEMKNGNRKESNEKYQMEMGNKEMENEKNNTENKSEIPVDAESSFINSNNLKYHGGMSMYEFNKQHGLPY